jgi:hypothetical protein
VLRQKGQARGLSRFGTGKPGILEVLFARDLIDEVDRPQNYEATCQPVSGDEIVKMMMILELYGLNDIAVDIARRFTDRLSTSRRRSIFWLTRCAAYLRAADPSAAPSAKTSDDRLVLKLERTYSLKG